MDTQIKTLEEMVGKTIAGITPTYDSSEKLFVFTDKTMALLHIRCDQYEDDNRIEVSWGKIDLTEFPREQVIASGAATTEEIDRLHTTKEERQRGHTEVLEREEYERLKKKFEG